MPDLPTDWTALCAIVFLLGLRHGFDADHLAAIDGMTRLGAGQRHARWCGAMFALGHGTIVLAIAAGVGLFSTRWLPPAWLNTLGAAVSIAFLLAIGIANLRALLLAAPGRPVAPIGLRGAAFARLTAARGPLGAAAVGALFALSFDTLNQAALFALAASRHGGVAPAFALGLLFVLGMLIADGVNGFWISHLIARADAAAALASRVMTLAVAAVSLGVAALGIGRWLWPGAAERALGSEAALGVIVVAVIAASYAMARLIAQPDASARPAPPARRAA